MSMESNIWRCFKTNNYVKDDQGIKKITFICEKQGKIIEVSLERQYTEYPSGLTTYKWSITPLSAKDITIIRPSILGITLPGRKTRSPRRIPEHLKTTLEETLNTYVL